VAIFPDALERAFGVGYDFVESWGVSQAGSRFSRLEPSPSLSRSA